ncbi:hypothetical protein CTAYLR_001121 [Chrysophaeum taylorii]|uniref:NAD-dependent epimerase/dehydratase domain-containing protein n=1 Tax=Chrysophaeum taylorii TaxID=2483200 RepID=A0AAD7UQN8_9STRA|nr:hypothetical protein CTAYLR_001121 [Chrysophaeum taylorii]
MHPRCCWLPTTTLLLKGSTTPRRLARALSIQSNEKKAVLVTGSKGQIGTELVEYLRGQYPKVIATDIRGGDHYLDVSAKDTTLLERLVVENDVGCVVHLAAVLSAAAERDAAAALRVNNGGTEMVLEVARRHALRVFVPSSIAVYGAGTPKRARENSPARPSTIYGVSKVYGEMLGEYYHERHGLDFRSLRIPGVISSKAMPGGGTTDWAVEIFYDAIRRSRYSCFLSPTTSLPMVYIDDLIKGIATFIQVPRSRLARSTYNVGAFSVSPANLAEAIRAELPFDCDYRISALRQAIADTWPESLDDSAARRDWDWNPTFDLRATTTTMIELLSNRLASAERAISLRPHHPVATLVAAST